MRQSTDTFTWWYAHGVTWYGIVRSGLVSTSAAVRISFILSFFGLSFRKPSNPQSVGDDPDIVVIRIPCTGRHQQAVLGDFQKSSAPQDDYQSQILAPGCGGLLPLSQKTRVKTSQLWPKAKHHHLLFRNSQEKLCSLNHSQKINILFKFCCNEFE